MAKLFLEYWERRLADVCFSDFVDNVAVCNVSSLDFEIKVDKTHS